MLSALASAAAAGQRPATRCVAGSITSLQYIFPLSYPQQYVILSSQNKYHHQQQQQQQQIRLATKKAGGSTSNGRDSAGRRLGIKLYPGLMAKPGAIIVRQRGKKFYPGTNVGMGKDHTIFSKVLGVVKFTRNHKNSNVVHVIE